MEITYQTKESGSWFNDKSYNVRKGRENKKITQKIARSETIKRFKAKGYNVPSNISNAKLVGCINDSAGFEWRKGQKKIKGVKAIIRKFYEINPVLYKAPISFFKGVYKNKEQKQKKIVKKNFVQTNDFLRSHEWRQLRYKALKLNDGRCELCGRGKKDGIILNVDHIQPRKTHPDLALDIKNLQILCNECNHGKGNKDNTDWRIKK